LRRQDQFASQFGPFYRNQNFLRVHLDVGCHLDSQIQLILRPWDRARITTNHLPCPSLCQKRSAATFHLSGQDSCE
jgi:hypothetical protein